jgi:hypothetical protein
MIGRAAWHNRDQTNASVEEATAEKIKSPVLERHLHSCDAS